MPEPTGVPPHEPVYQNQLAPAPKLPPLTLKVVVKPGEQLTVGTELIEVGATETVPEEMVINIHAFALAVAGLV